MKDFNLRFKNHRYVKEISKKFDNGKGRVYFSPLEDYASICGFINHVYCDLTFRKDTVRCPSTTDLGEMKVKRMLIDISFIGDLLMINKYDPFTGKTINFK